MLCTLQGIWNSSRKLWQSQRRSTIEINFYLWHLQNKGQFEHLTSHSLLSLCGYLASVYLYSWEWVMLCILWWQKWGCTACYNLIFLPIGLGIFYIALYLSWKYLPCVQCSVCGSGSGYESRKNRLHIQIRKNHSGSRQLWIRNDFEIKLLWKTDQIWQFLNKKA